MCWCVGEAKRHHQELVMVLMHAEGGHLGVWLVHANMMIPIAEIKLNEETSVLSSSRSSSTIGI